MVITRSCRDMSFVAFVAFFGLVFDADFCADIVQTFAHKKWSLTALMKSPKKVQITI